MAGHPDSNPGLLFAYGTLMPVDRRAMVLGNWEPDAARGRLHDLVPYPVLFDLDDPSAGWVEGFVRPVRMREILDRLDPYEGVAEGLFRRSSAITRSGRRAWIYVYARPLPRDARGPIPRWEGPRGALGPRADPEELDDGLDDRLEAAP